MALRTLFYRRSAVHSVDCWYFFIGEDRTGYIQHTWEHPDEENEPTIGSTMIDAEHFMETTEDLQVLGGLCAILPDQQCWTEGAGDTLTRAKNRLLH